MTDEEILQAGRDVVSIEIGALIDLRDQLDNSFVQAHRLLAACSGRVVVSGMGKSGHIARKIAATLASTGTPAFFMHPAEASHGDLGMITEQDVLVAISYSGESDELSVIVPLIKRRAIPIIAITGRVNSRLAQWADVHLDVSVKREACSLNLAPTSSTTATLALGDALAVSLLRSSGFTMEDFGRTHPGGSLGKRLLMRVQDLMRQGTHIPRVAPTDSVLQALSEISAKSLGMTAVVDEENRLLGVFTDGDLRRVLEHNSSDLKQVSVAQVMTVTPKSIAPTELAAKATLLMQKRKISALCVVNQERHLIGVVHTFDLMKAGVL